MAGNSKSFDPQIISKTCMSVVESAMEKMGNLTFSQPPEFAERKIIEYNSRMRVFGMEVFNSPCFVSHVNYYLSERHLKQHDSCGAFVLYIEEDSAGKLLKALGHKKLDEQNHEVMFDACGELCNTLGGNFKNEIVKLGYQDLVVSAPVNNYNNVPDGVEFHFDQYTKYETSFYFWKQKVIVVDVTMNPIPKR